MAQGFSCQDQGHGSNSWVGNHRLFHTISFHEELSDHLDANGSGPPGPGALLAHRAKQTSCILQTSLCHCLCSAAPSPTLRLFSQTTTLLPDNHFFANKLKKNNLKGILKKNLSRSQSTLLHFLQSTSSLGLSLSRGVTGDNHPWEITFPAGPLSLHSAPFLPRPRAMGGFLKLVVHSAAHLPRKEGQGFYQRHRGHTFGHLYFFQLASFEAE